MKHRTLKTTPEISYRMARVHLKKGREEVLLAKRLWHLGYRYWLNYKKLPGSPDIAIKKYNIAIFVDGEFWHGYDWENRKETIKNNRDYWVEKIEENMERDCRVDAELRQIGWIPVRFWSNQIDEYTEECVEEILDLIREIQQINSNTI